MSLRHAVLATLLEGEASGYDLSKSFDAGAANFWMATPQQLYRELDKMSDEGLIEARVVQQERRPNKRLFSLTDAGRRALYDFTAAPPRPGAIREELMVQVQAIDAGDAQAVMNAIRERMTWAESKIARFEHLRARFLDGRAEDEYLATADRIGPYLTLMRGLAFERENLRWCRQTLAVLTDRAESLPQQVTGSAKP